MYNHILTEIGSKIRKVRQSKNLTVQELADRAGVSKGLISRIENSRTIPSLPVLISIIKALEVEINSFFEDIDQPIDEQKIIVRRQADLENVIMEGAEGFLYHPVINRSFSDFVVQVTVLDLEPGSQREKLITDAYEFKYILNGEVDYEIGDQKLTLHAGDSIYFDGRLPHVPVNRSEEKVRMLVVYFLLPNG